MRPKVGSAKIGQKMAHKCWEVAAAAAPIHMPTHTHIHMEVAFNSNRIFSRFRVITFFGVALRLALFVRFFRFVFCANFFNANLVMGEKEVLCIDI